jgi:predicted  nucleic acid-binding Zn-ribbon protein
MKSNIVIIAIIAVLAVFLYECNGTDEAFQKQYSALQEANRQLDQAITTRDMFVDTVTTSINDLYTGIQDLQAKEKSLLNETSKMESEKKLTADELHTKLIDRINIIRATLSENHKRLADLRSKLSSSKKQYAGIEQIVENMKKTLDDRDQTIADLGNRIQGLQQTIGEKNNLLTQKDSVIDSQYKQISTAYYIAGTKDQLEKMGIIKKEGGFLWGWLGSTTTLASGFDDKNFKPINRLVENNIHVDGKIDEIIPKRAEQFYKKTEISENESLLTIAQPDTFWRDKYLVIITDKPNAN